MLDRLYPYYCGAGRGALRRYREISGRWRGRVFRRTWGIAAVLCLAVLVVADVDHRHSWLLLVGVFLGGLTGGYIALLDSPPGRIEQWRTGFEGERRTARALAPLRRRGCVLLHDLPDRRIADRDYKGNIDHVVVSPAGVFLLDSKWLGGEVSIVGDCVHVQMPDDEDDCYDHHRLARGIRGHAVRLQEDIKQQTGISFVQAVMVFWNDFEQELVMEGNVVFVHGERLAGWLEEQCGEMAPEWVARVGACIAEARPSEHPGRWHQLNGLKRRKRGTLPRSLPATSAAPKS